MAGQVTVIDETDVPKEEAELNISRFFFTINSNRTEEALGEDGIATFKSRVKNMFKNFHLFLHPREGYPEDPDMKVTVRTAFESGERKKRLHAHALIDVFHHTNILVDYETLQLTMKNYGYYAQSKFAKSSNDQIRMLRYIRKNI